MNHVSYIRSRFGLSYLEDLTMYEFTLSELLREVHCHLQHAVVEALPGTNWCAPLPRCFGIQQYLLADPTSDVELLVLAPVQVAAQVNQM